MVTHVPDDAFRCALDHEDGGRPRGLGEAVAGHGELVLYKRGRGRKEAEGGGRKRKEEEGGGRKALEGCEARSRTW